MLQKRLPINGVLSVTNLPVVIMFVLLVSVSGVYIVYGMYRRRQLMRRIANGELPPQWDGLAWDDFVDRQREENNDVGPTPELYDAYIALDTLGVGVWSTFMPVMAKVSPNGPSTHGKTASLSNLTIPTYQTWSPPRRNLFAQWRRSARAVHRPAETQTTANPSPSVLLSSSEPHKAIESTDIPSSSAELAMNLDGGNVDIAVFITMPTQSSKHTAVTDLPELTGLNLGYAIVTRMSKP